MKQHTDKCAINQGYNPMNTEEYPPTIICDCEARLKDINAYAFNDYDWLIPRIVKLGVTEFKETVIVSDSYGNKIELKECFRSIDGEVVIYSQDGDSQRIMDVIMDNQ